MESNCINCKESTTGKYCSNCGQLSQPKKITWRYISAEITDRWFGLDTRFAQTSIGLFKNPGRVIKEYLDRNTVKYVGPLGYYLVMTALMILLFELLNIDIGEFLENSRQSLGIPEQESAEKSEIQAKLNSWIADNFRFIALFMIPFMALSTKILYRKSRKSFLENLIIAIYTQTHTIWFTMIFTIIYSFTGYVNNLVLLLSSTVYFAYAMQSVFTGRYKVLRFFKGILVWLIGYIFFFLGVFVIGIVIGSFFALNQ